MMAHWPAETLAGILNSQPMGFYSPRLLLNEARRKGMGVLPPDLRRSEDGFTVEDDGRALRPGLSYCRDLSRAAVSSILSERAKRPFASVADLYRRTPTDRGALENLIRAGFLDHLGYRPGDRSSPRSLAEERGEARAALLRAIRSLPEKRQRGWEAQRELPLPHPASWWESREGRGSGVATLAPHSTDLERWEARVLGLDLRRHPLAAHREALEALGVTAGRELRSLPHGTRARAAGILESLQAPPTRSGALVNFLLTEDESGLLQSTIFENVYRRYGHVLHQSGAFLLDGRVELDRRRGRSYLVERIHDLGEVFSDGEVPSSRAAVSGAFMRAGLGPRRGRRAG